jgi:hypothetical protein
MPWPLLLLLLQDDENSCFRCCCCCCRMMKTVVSAAAAAAAAVCGGMPKAHPKLNVQEYTWAFAKQQQLLTDQHGDQMMNES